ncbi:hypothetical protein [Clostridium sp.]|uniref:hypothetical protein n=1 Tax=Clostridium sp. TaxID=1506 RepID=UPI00262A7BD2|nr:hypothetical protein [Clostridium sp.]
MKYYKNNISIEAEDEKEAEIVIDSINKSEEKTCIYNKTRRCIECGTCKNIRKD